MKITISMTQDNFTQNQLDSLAQWGTVVFSTSKQEMTVEELIELTRDSDILVADPDNFGGFEKAKERLTAVMEKLPHLKGVALSTTSFGWIDLDYCNKRGIAVSNIPGYSREAVAEHTLALLLCTAKNILVTDRKTQKEMYEIQMGFELKGKILGIIGVGNIGSRTAELGKAIGMNVVGFNRTAKTVPGVEMISLEELLKKSDAIAIHTTHEPANENLIGEKELRSVKNGVIFVNTADRTVINEEAMAKALISKQVAGYAFEAEDLKTGPLATLENAVALKGFGWYTKEAIERLIQILVDSVVAHAAGKPIHLVVVK